MDLLQVCAEKQASMNKLIDEAPLPWQRMLALLWHSRPFRHCFRNCQTWMRIVHGSTRVGMLRI